MSDRTAFPTKHTPSLSKVRIVIVEDDPLMQLGLEQAFADISHLEIIAQAEDGYLGIEAAIQLKPDIVIMDIGLPRLDGIAATQKIKETLPEIAIVMLTSHTVETEVIAALAAGADAYCLKGAKIERLLRAIAIAQDGGKYLDPQIAQVVVKHLKPPSSSYKIGYLSEREMDVLKLIVEGKTNPEIAAELYLSTNTIKTHVRSILNKLAVSDRVQAAVVALRSGLIS